MELEEKVIQSNKEFWGKENVSDANCGMLVYENFYDTPQLCYGISKVALCLAKSLGLRPAVILSWHENEISKSMCETQFQMKNELTSIIIRYFLFLIRCFFINRTALLKLRDGEAEIGTFIYDSILIKYKKKTISTLSLKERLFVILQLCYYLYFKRIITKNKVEAVVLGDCVYRYGLMFELCRLNNIKCFTPVNLNSLFIRCFKTENDYHTSYLNNQLVEELCKGMDYDNTIDDYYSKRYQGKIEQHDVLTAYGNKQVTDLNKFEKKYNLMKGKKTVVIMCHVFADAPHVYLDTLYDDYWEWFVGTLQNLKKNPHINILVKEHPSSHLYGQKGIVKEYLRSMDLDNLLVKDDESTVSILKNADVVVTCGGTIGMEFSYRGKNVVLASYPPFGRLGFTTEFNSREEYEKFLRERIQYIQPLNSEQLEMARKVSYITFCLQDNSSKDLELGGDVILMGKEYDNTILYNNIMEYNKKSLNSQNIYKLLDSFAKSDKVALFK